MNGYVYIRSEPGLWTTGSYNDDGRWFPEADHGTEREAAERTAELNKQDQDGGSYDYVRSESSLWTVGFDGPDGSWVPESDHSSASEADRRANWLNGF